MVNVVQERLIPAKALLLVDPNDQECIIHRKNEIASKMSAKEGRATAYVCRHHACSLPVSDPSQLAELLDSQEWILFFLPTKLNWFNRDDLFKMFSKFKYSQEQWTLSRNCNNGGSIDLKVERIVTFQKNMRIFVAANSVREIMWN